MFFPKKLKFGNSLKSLKKQNINNAVLIHIWDMFSQTRTLTYTHIYIHKHTTKHMKTHQQTTLSFASFLCLSYSYPLNKTTAIDEHNSRTRAIVIVVKRQQQQQLL